MPTPFAPSTMSELATRLEQRRTYSARLAASLHAEADHALEGLDLSDVFDSDNPDSGTNEVDRARALALAHLATSTAGAVDDALARLEAGTYGICDGCGTRIPLARLRAVPETRMCVTCKMNEGRLLALAG